MKIKKSWSEKLRSVLKEARIPAVVIDKIINIGKNTLTAAAFADDKSVFTALPGIADKRAQIITACVKKNFMNGRLSTKVAKRDKPSAFTLRTFSAEELFRKELADIVRLSEFYPDKDHPEATVVARGELQELIEKLTAKESFTVRKSEGRITRLNRSILSDVFGIDYNQPKPTNELIIAEHRIQKLLDFHWTLFAATEEEGKELLDELCQQVYVRLGTYGLKVLSNGPDNATIIELYGGIASSASHQKNEKLLMGEYRTMAAHQEFLWLGRPMQSFVNDVAMTGAEFWKFRANIIRPILRTYKDKDGNDLTIHDVLFVKDVKKTYKFKWARRFGGVSGGQFREGEDQEDVIMGDGAALGTDNQQGGGAGLKWMMIDKESTDKAVAERHGITLDQLYDTMVEGADKRLHRYGDYKVICGDGCWKFDKAFNSLDTYVEWMDKMEKRYPGFSKLYVLRNSEEVEGEEKVRRLTRTLIQQWMVMTESERIRLTKKVRTGLKEGKTLEGQIKKLAALWKAPEDRTMIERLYYAAPWLILNPCIQMWLEEKWSRKQTEAASGKFRTEGQYPYIMQDPVALLEVWVLGMNPNDPELGLLRGDEVSVADVPDGKELCCVRFPANYLTAKVMRNHAFTKAFASCGNVAIISIHSDILIRQDGDVDGDEMCILYNKLTVSMTKRMIDTYNPPVILFEHGSKAERKQFGGRDGYIREAYVALWRAKKFDSVGINANLATACAYLASCAENDGNIALRDKYLLWMSAGSTGAILAIDQVKGNAVDENLIMWLDTIKKDVRSALRKIAESFGISKDESYKIRYPFVHYYVAAAKRRPVSFEECVPLNENNLCDSLCQLILNDTGKWEFNAQGAYWNKEAAKDAILNHTLHTTKVRNGIVSKELIEEIGYNWFRRTLNSEDKKMIGQLRVGKEISMKDIMLLMHRNEMAMSYSMEGANLAEKKAEYWKTCKKVLYMLADSKDWIASAYAKDVPEGYVYSVEEKHASVANAFISDALELGNKGNNVDAKGGWATFVLNVFVEEALDNILTNKVDNSRFFGIGCSTEDLEIDVVLDILSDDKELFESTPEETASENNVIPEEEFGHQEWIPTDEELEQLIPDYIEDCEYQFC